MYQQRKARRRSKLLAQINVVPYIDVMLVLLIAFMMATPLIHQGVKVDLPVARSKPLSQQSPPLIITIDRLGHYYLNALDAPSRPVSLKKLILNLLAQRQLAGQSGMIRPVLIQADKQVNYGHVVQVMSLLQQAHITPLGLVTHSTSASLAK